MPDHAERRTPEQWLTHPDHAGVRILDCDGWTLDEWPQPISRTEFESRLVRCTLANAAWTPTAQPTTEETR